MKLILLHRSSFHAFSAFDFVTDEIQDDVKEDDGYQLECSFAADFLKNNKGFKKICSEDVEHFIDIDIAMWNWLNELEGKGWEIVRV